MTQPKALFLADVLEDTGNSVNDAAAAELRRLYEFAMEQQGKIYALEMARSMQQRTAKLKHDALLEALHSISLAAQDSGSTREGMGLYARAAIAKVEEKQ